MQDNMLHLEAAVPESAAASLVPDVRDSDLGSEADGEADLGGASEVLDASPSTGAAGPAVEQAMAAPDGGHQGLRDLEAVCCPWAGVSVGVAPAWMRRSARAWRRPGPQVALGSRRSCVHLR
ncbi:unnamed protein product [Prorocentrum cordatum]|uniref:Uncharacterized protein n=1 Tax=Prorocentrum cordatum TaxID=2364126 RepID=A0ABN9W496_9DINO|nr:unnamed protein product [Polarella glacialis]